MNGTADAVQFARITAEELSCVGINMNYAPVLDVAPKEINSIMAARVFGHDPDQVAHMGATVIQQLQDRGVMAVAKHFPGIGRTTLDSHLDLPTLDATLSDLDAFDLIPFRRAIHAGVAGVMLSHIRYPRIDSVWPASLSPAIARDLLRVRLKYNGVVMTDDLDMGAIEKHFGFKAAVAQVVASDVDMALVCHRSDKIETAFEEILNWGESATGAPARARQSVERILKLKRQYSPDGK